MGTGADLRSARIARNRSIDDISRVTKISPTVLSAIENEQFNRIPGGLFRRGYLRAYAREVGLDPEEVVQKYRDEFEPAAADQKLPHELAESPRIRLAPDEDVLTRSRPFIELGVIALIAAVCFAFVIRASKPAAPVETHAPAPAPAPQTPKDDTVAGTSGSRDALPAEVKIQMRATGPCWIEAVSGDKRLVARLMTQGDTETVTVRNDVSLRVGDPSTLSYTIDGMPGRAFGPAGKPVSVQISPRNYRAFLAARR